MKIRNSLREAIKFFSIVLCYIIIVLNIMFSDSLWGIVCILAVWFIFLSIPFGEIDDIKCYLMSLILKLMVLYFAAAIVFLNLNSFCHCLMYCFFAIQGMFFYLNLPFSYSKIHNGKRTIYLFISLILCIVWDGIFLFKGVKGEISDISCSVMSIIITLFNILKYRNDIKKYLKKCLNMQKDFI